MQVQRKKIYDPSFEEFVNEELPTVSIKDVKRLTGVIPAGTALLRRTFSGGTAMRLTYVAFRASAETEFFMRDREGTFDYPFLEAAGGEVWSGGPNEPRVVEGSFVIGIQGSYASGTRVAAYEGFVRFQGTETRD